MYKLWECPICHTDFDREGLNGMVLKLMSWLEDRQGISASLDPQFEKRKHVGELLSELKLLQIQECREPSKMMDSQHITEENC
jgi:hypothetical protein